jgi:hypothetical protein
VTPTPQPQDATREALSARIEQTRRRFREHAEAGHESDAALLEEYLNGLTFAYRLMFTDDPTCPHSVHRFVRTDERGVNVWACKSCGEPYPPNAKLAAVTPEEQSAR